MFASFRKALGSFFIMILLGLLVASFAVWGIGDVFSGNRQTTVAAVGETRIDINDFLTAYQREIQAQEQRSQEPLDRDQARAQGLPQQVLGAMVERAALDEAARRLGLRVSDESIAAEIRKIEAFQGFNGQFDRDVFASVLRNNGYRTDQFLKVVRDDLARRQLVEAFTTEAPLPRPIAEELYRVTFESRVAEVLTIPQSAISLDEEPSEETLREFHDLNAGRYAVPEYRAVSALFLDPAVLGDQDAVSDADLEEAYQARLGDYVVPEKRSLSMVSFDPVASDSASQAKAAIDQGASLEDAAQDFTDFTAEELELGEFDRSTLETAFSPAIADAVFQLPEGGVSEPLQSAFGWHLFRVDTVVAGQSRELDDVREELRTKVAGERALDMIYDLSRDVEDRLLGGEALADIARELSVPLATSEAIAVNGLGKDGRLVRTEPSLLPALPKAFEMLQGDDPALIEYADGGFAFVAVSSIEPPSTSPYEEVVAQVRADYINDEKQRLAGLKADALIERVRAGEALSALTDEAGGTFVVTEPIQRGRPDSNLLSPAVASLLFDLNLNQAEISQTATGDGYLIIKPVQITVPEPDQDPLQYGAFTSRLGGYRQNEILQHMSLGVRAITTIEVNGAVVERALDLL